MPRKEKFKEYEYNTKITTIRIPDLKDLDKEKQLREAIDNFVLEYLRLKPNTILKANTIDTSILKKMIPEFVKAGIKTYLESNEIERIKQLYGGG